MSQSNKVLVQSKAVYLSGKKKLHLGTHTWFENDLGSNDVLIKMAYAGICGSDMHFVLHGCHETRVIDEPVILGHEGSGVIVRTGSNVGKGLKVGDRVAIEPNSFCRQCHTCLSGRHGLCDEQVEIPPKQGMFQEYYVSPDYLVYKLPENVTLEEGAMVEPFSGIVYSLHKRIEGGIKCGDRVLVLGAGPMGLLTSIVAKAMGAGDIVITDVSKLRLDHAVTKVGVTHGYNVTIDQTMKSKTQDEIAKKQAREIQELLSGHQPDVCVDCVGYESSLSLALEATKKGGTVVMYGVGGVATKSATLTLPSFIVNIVSRGLTIAGHARSSGGGFGHALRLMGEGKIDPKPAIGDIVSIDEFERAFLDLAASVKSTGRIMLKM